MPHPAQLSDDEGSDAARAAASDTLACGRLSEPPEYDPARGGDDDWQLPADAYAALDSLDSVGQGLDELVWGFARGGKTP